jgi:hypothetical protein
MSPARLDAFAQRIARTIVQREVAIAREGDDFRNMKVRCRQPLIVDFPPPLFFFIKKKNL